MYLLQIAFKVLRQLTFAQEFIEVLVIFGSKQPKSNNLKLTCSVLATESRHSTRKKTRLWSHVFVVFVLFFVLLF